MARRSRFKNGGTTMNTISLFGAASCPGTWLQTVLALSALTMVSTFPEMQRLALQARPIPVSLPLSCLFGLAAASMMAGIMQPELLAAVFAQT